MTRPRHRMNDNRGIHDDDPGKLRQFALLDAEANTIRERDKFLIKGLFQNFYGKKLNVGIGFQRAYGAILSGDYFDLIKLPDGNYLFIFADMSGHGLPAYTNLVRLRSAITISISHREEDIRPVRHRQLRFPRSTHQHHLYGHHGGIEFP